MFVRIVEKYVMKENDNREQLRFIGRQNSECFVNGETIYNLRVQRYGVGFGCCNAKCMQNTLTINNVSDGR